jgi:uncharacterized membrane protein YqjE
MEASNGGRDQSMGELVKQLADQTSSLVRQEMELAKAELREKGKLAGMGAGAFGGAGLLGLFALGTLTAAAILGLATAVDGWLAALIVTAVYGAVAGVLALVGRTKVQAATPPIPEQTTESVKEDVEWTRTRAAQGRR